MAGDGEGACADVNGVDLGARELESEGDGDAAAAGADVEDG